MDFELRVDRVVHHTTHREVVLEPPAPVIATVGGGRPTHISGVLTLQVGHDFPAKAGEVWTVSLNRKAKP